MKTLSFKTTEDLVHLVLNQPKADVRRRLHEELLARNSNQARFFASVVKFHSKLPNEVLWSDLDLKNKLSENQFKRLPPAGD